MAQMTPPPAGATADLELVEQMVASGRLREAVDHLAGVNRSLDDPELEVRLVELRHRAACRELPTATSRDEWPPRTDHTFDQDEVPELAAPDITVDLLSAALNQHGCLLVRGLLPAAENDRLLSYTHQAFAACQAAADGAPLERTSPWYAPFRTEDPEEFGAFERAFANYGGGVLSVESPRTLNCLIDTFRSIGLGDLLAGYLGEWPALSAKKSTLRSANPSSITGWHQDGAFLGRHTRTVNAWVALTACGVDAPSIDVYPQAFDHIVETGTEGAPWDWSVSPTEVDRLGSERVRRLVFEPGDALLFNQMTLHRTGVSEHMTKERFAIESWFFAPSTYPEAQLPIMF